MDFKYFKNLFLNIQTFDTIYKGKQDITNFRTSLLTMKELKLSVDEIERIADNLVDKNNYMINYE